MEIIDTHCHLDVTSFDKDRDDVLEQCRKQGITKIIVPAIIAKTWNNLLNLCKKEKGLYPTLGLHPIFIEQHDESDLALLENTLKNNLPVAIGEIGLDFYSKELDKNKQVMLFEQQLFLAKKYHLPVILHVRKAHDQVLQLLKKIKVKGGFCHAFNGSIQQAEKYIELGFKLGFGGTLTYTNSKKIHQLATAIPLEHIVLETDAPDMVVESHRGERNSPEYIVEALNVLATLRHKSVGFIANQTTLNANNVIDFSNYDQRK